MIKKIKEFIKLNKILNKFIVVDIADIKLYEIYNEFHKIENIIKDISELGLSGFIIKHFKNDNLYYGGYIQVMKTDNESGFFNGIIHHKHHNLNNVDLEIRFEICDKYIKLCFTVDYRPTVIKEKNKYFIKEHRLPIEERQYYLEKFNILFKDFKYDSTVFYGPALFGINAPENFDRHLECNKHIQYMIIKELLTEENFLEKAINTIKY